MTDLDSALRTMLRERAADIDRLPVDFLHLPSLDVLDRDPIQDGRRGHRSTWLVAAAVITVLAVVAVTIGVRRGGGSPDKKITPATHSPTVSGTATRATPTPTTVSPHAIRTAALSWFGMKQLAGYELHMRASEPGYRQLAVRRADDTATPIGCNGCESASDYITVFDKGIFDAAAAGVTSWRPVTVGETPGYLGTMKQYLGRDDVGKYELPTVAWEFRPGRWAIVQGVTAAGDTQAALLKVARAVEPTLSVPIGLPFTLGYVPDMPVTEVVDDRSEGYAFTMTFGDTEHRSLTITLWKGSAWTYYDPKGQGRHSIGGRPGYLGPDQGAGVLYHGGGAALGIDDEDSARPTAADDRELQKVLAELHWVNHDGRAPLVPAEQAIP